MNLPQYCPVPDAPVFCFPNTADWIMIGMSVFAWALLFWMKWIDPLRPVIEKITGKPWWRNGW